MRQMEANNYDRIENNQDGLTQRKITNISLMALFMVSLITISIMWAISGKKPLGYIEKLPFYSKMIAFILTVVFFILVFKGITKKSDKRD